MGSNVNPYITGGAGFTLENASRPGQPFQVGDAWVLTVMGPPGLVVQGGWPVQMVWSSQIGMTNAQGIYQAAGNMQVAGTFSVGFSVAGGAAFPVANQYVVAPASSAPNAQPSANPAPTSVVLGYGKYGENDEGMYVYGETPEGDADIFFIYVFDSSIAVGTGPLTNGEDYNLLGISVTDGGFVCRAWNGAYSVLNQTAGSLGQIQIYGQNKDKWFDNPVSVYTPNPTQQCASVIPEKAYVVDSAIRFDLLNTFLRLI